MKKQSSLSCVIAAMLCLTAGFAMASDETDAQAVKAVSASSPENPPQPKEEAAKSSQDTAAPAQKEPECD